MIFRYDHFRIKDGKSARTHSFVRRWLVAWSRIKESVTSWNSNATQRRCACRRDRCRTRETKIPQQRLEDSVHDYSKRRRAGRPQSILRRIEGKIIVLSHIRVLRKTRSPFHKESVRQVAQRMHEEDIASRPSKKLNLAYHYMEARLTER